MGWTQLIVMNHVHTRNINWGPYGTLGVGGGFAVGAATIYPNRPIFIIYGDGSAGYSLVEVDTAKRHSLNKIKVSLVIFISVLDLNVLHHPSNTSCIWFLAIFRLKFQNASLW